MKDGALDRGLLVSYLEDLGETGSAEITDAGELYTRREENAQRRFCGEVWDVTEARAALQEFFEGAQ